MNFTYILNFRKKNYVGCSFSLERCAHAIAAIANAIDKTANPFIVSLKKNEPIANATIILKHDQTRFVCPKLENVYTRNNKYATVAYAIIPVITSVPHLFPFVRFAFRKHVCAIASEIVIKKIISNAADIIFKFF
jgi:hypothetical protein